MASKNSVVSGILAMRRTLSSSSSEEATAASDDASSRMPASMSASSTKSGIQLNPGSLTSDVSSIRDMPSRISRRGALIAGVALPRMTSYDNDDEFDIAKEMEAPPQSDLEEGNENSSPDSDYAPGFGRSSSQMVNVSLCADEKTDALNSPKWLQRSKQADGKAPSITSGSSYDDYNDINAAGEKNNFQRSNEITSDNQRRRPKRLWYSLTAISVVLFVAVITLMVLTIGGGNKLSPQQQQLSNIAKSISDESDLKTQTSPQAQAYNWLVFEDELFTKSDTDIPQGLATQRYVLAVFYFATSGMTAWQDKAQWLLPTISECHEGKLWTGLSCNEQGEVRAMVFGK